MTVRPLQRYRPEMSDDSDHGFSESLGDPVKVFGQVSWHDNDLVFICRAEQDIKEDDVLESPDGVQYRVTSETRPTGALKVEYGIERKERNGKS